MPVELNQDIFDFMIRNQIATGRYANKVTRDIIAILNQADKEIIDKIAKTNGEWTKARLDKLLEWIRETNAAFYTDANVEMKQQMFDFAGVQATAATSLLASQVPVNFDVIGMTNAQLRAIVDKTPITVGADKKLLLEEIFQSLAAGKEELIRGAIRSGMVQGESIPELTRRLIGTRANRYQDGILETSRRHATTMTRTITNAVGNNSMMATYEANSSIVAKWVFTATLDGRTSITCRSLSGKEFPIGKGPLPPRHPNCRSVAVPKLKSWRDMGFDVDEIPAGMRASKGGTVRADITMAEWLKQQPKDEVIDMLGKTRAKLFLDGKLKLESFADDQGRVYTLEQLKEQHSRAFAK
jgi:SPP1 gp7 family putative phage head morphogenesis protein